MLSLLPVIAGLLVWTIAYDSTRCSGRFTRLCLSLLAFPGGTGYTRIDLALGGNDWDYPRQLYLLGKT